MPRQDPDDSDEEESDADGPGGRRTTILQLLQLLLVLLLVMGGLFVVRQLRDMSHLQDCVMSGRTNCAPIHVPPD